MLSRIARLDILKRYTTVYVERRAAIFRVNGAIENQTTPSFHGLSSTILIPQFAMMVSD